MPAFLTQVLSQLKNLWLELSGAQRLTVGVVLLATLVGMAALVWVSTRPSYEPLPVALSGSENADVITLFTQENIDFRTDAAGNVSVDSGDLQRATTLLVRDGYMSGSGTDLKELESGGAMMRPRQLTDYALLTHKAKRSERQIAGLRGVRSAVVMVHKPATSTFVGRQTNGGASASVLLTLSATADFRRLAAAAAGIVANGLGLERQDVLVTSNLGDTFIDSEDGSGRGTGGFSELLALELKASSVKTGIAQQRLSEIWPGKATVQVSVAYANSIGSERRVLTPEEKILRSETKFESSSKNQRPGSGGDPNSTGSLGGSSVAPTGTGPAGTETEQSQSKKEYESNVGSSVKTELAPQIEQMTVSLILDKSLEPQRTAITEQVKQLVGWKKDRDPDFTAIVTEFPSFEDVPEEGAGVTQMLEQYGPLAGQVLSVALVLLFLRGLLKRHRPAPVPAPAAPKSEAEEAVEDPAKEAKRLRREIERVVASDPGSVTRLLEGWLTEKASS